MLFKITNGAVDLGAETVLEEINFEIRDREKIAVVGRNGAGKTTLLKVITGEVELTEGVGEERKIVVTSGAPVIGYLTQHAFIDESVTLVDEVRRAYSEVIALEEEISKIENLLEISPTEKLLTQLTDKRERFELLGGLYYKREYESAIKKFGFSESDKYKPISEFSGGQRTRIALIRLILSKPDILLLDEPTNHLDVTAIEWLQEYLKNYKKSIVLVSHDRMFLDKVVNVVYEIEYGATTRYVGNYTKFLQEKKQNYLKQLKDHEAQVREIDRLRKIADRFRYKPTKAKMALSKLKQIERMEIIDAPDRYDTRTYHGVEIDEQSVKEALVVKDLVVGYDEPLAKVNLELTRGEKLGVIGSNGTGKSTFLKTLVGKLDKLSGQFDFGLRVKVGYFDQQMANVTSDKSVFDEFYDEFPYLNEKEVRSSLGAFGFTGEEVFKTVSVLSGGEKVRLALCKIFKRKPNFLILDEPTNHMDIVGKETLEDILTSYEGTVIVVSHDRYLINRVSNRILEFSDSGAKLYDCGYEQYLEQRDNTVEILDKPKTVQKEKKGYYNPLKEQQKKERRIAKLEEEIGSIESQISILNESLTDESVYSDYLKCDEIQQKINALTENLNALEEEYLILTSD